MRRGALVQRRRRRGRVTVVFDAFARADNASSLGTADTGQAWNAVVGTWGVIGGAAYCSSATSNALALIASGVSDGIVRATFAVDVSSGFGQRLVVRATDASNNLFVTNTDGAGTIGDNVSLWKRVAGSATLVGSAATHAWAAGDVVEVGMAGGALTVRVNGQALITATSTFNQTATQHGMQAPSTSAARWDEFRVIAP